MIFKIGKLQFRIYASKLEKRIGICSQSYNEPEKHMLLWDFDKVELEDIVYAMNLLRVKHQLPNIYVIQSSPKGGYHGYCFTSRSFRETINILSDTPFIDMTYLRLGIVRGYFTLRITPRKGEPNFKLVYTIYSSIPDEMQHDAMTVNEYMTSNKGRKNAKRKTN